MFSSAKKHKTISPKRSEPDAISAIADLFQQVGEKFGGYLAFHDLFVSHRQLNSEVSAAKRKKIWHLRKQIIYHYFKNFFLFPVLLVKLLTPSYFKGEVNVWTNLAAIIKRREFKPLRMAIVSQLFFLYVVIHLGSYIFYHHALPTLAATYNLTQTSWSGGASTTLTAVHPPGSWTYFYSSHANLDTSNNEVKLAFTSQSARTQTADEDFNAGTSTNAYITGGSVVMLKPETATCAASAECASNYCKTGTCNPPPLACDGSEGAITCGNDCAYYGEYYTTVVIGTQCWFAENLRTTKYPDGTDITKGAVAHKASGWTDRLTMYYSCPPNVTNDGEDADCGNAVDGNGYKLGLLYQWRAAMNDAAGVASGTGPQGICPAGWHIPTDNNATTSGWGLLNSTLTTLCGAGAEGNCAVTGVSNFHVPLAGYREAGWYYWRNLIAKFWSSSALAYNTSYLRNVDTSPDTFASSSRFNYAVYAVRCLKNP